MVDEADVDVRRAPRARSSTTASRATVRVDRLTTARRGRLHVVAGRPPGAGVRRRAARARRRRAAARCTSRRRYLGVRHRRTTRRRGTCGWSCVLARPHRVARVTGRATTARRAVRRPRRPDPAGGARAPGARRPADGDDARRALPDHAPGDRQAPARCSPTPELVVAERDGREVRYRRRPSASPTPSRGCSAPAGAGTAASTRLPSRR